MGGFILPHSPSLRCQDRFDLLESDEDEVPFWDLLCAILTNPSTPVTDIGSLIETLEIIAVSLRGNTGTDHGFLRRFLETYLETSTKHNRFFTQTWTMLVQIALEMPNLFPETNLPAFTDNGLISCRLSRRQVACLVIHQFLCSLPTQPWSTESFVDLSPWYTSKNNDLHPHVVHAYLTALFTYFDRAASTNQQNHLLSFDLNEWPVTFTLRTLSSQEQSDALTTLQNPLSKIEITELPQVSTDPSYLGLPDGACVISANKCLGYGRTGTQEELHVGCSPEAYPSVLFVPPLKDNQVFICQGAEEIVSIKGYGRDARLDQVLKSSLDGEVPDWRRRTMLFMDALELDAFAADSSNPGRQIIPDLLQGNVSRELMKCYAGFSSAALISDNSSNFYSSNTTGLWGCGTFGGNKEIKSLIQICAASMASVPVLNFVFAGSDQLEFARRLEGFLTSAEKVQMEKVTPFAIFQVLLALEERMLNDGSIELEPDRVLEYVWKELVK